MNKKGNITTGTREIQKIMRTNVKNLLHKIQKSKKHGWVLRSIQHVTTKSRWNKQFKISSASNDTEGIIQNLPLIKAPEPVWLLRKSTRTSKKNWHQYYSNYSMN